MLKHYRNLYGYQSIFHIAALIQFILSFHVWSFAVYVLDVGTGKNFYDLGILVSTILAPYTHHSPLKSCHPLRFLFQSIYIRGLIDLFPFSGYVSAYQRHRLSFLLGFDFLDLKASFPLCFLSCLYGWSYKMLTIYLRRNNYREDMHM